MVTVYLYIATVDSIVTIVTCHHGTVGLQTACLIGYVWMHARGKLCDHVTYTS